MQTSRCQPRDWMLFAAIVVAGILLRVYGMGELRKILRRGVNGGGIWLLTARGRLPEDEALAILKSNFEPITTHHFFKTQAQYWAPVTLLEIP